MKYPMIPITFFLVNGIFVSGYFRWIPDYTLIVLLLILSLLGLVYAHLSLKQYSHHQFFAAFYFVNVCLFSFLLGIFLSSVRVQKESQLSDGDMQGVLEITEFLKSNKRNNRYYGMFYAFEGKKEKVLVYQSIQQPKWHIGSRQMIYGKISRINVSKSPYSFDYSVYLQRKNIFKQLHVRSFEQSLPDNKDIFYYVIQWRDKILNSFRIHAYSNDVFPLIDGLLFGVRTDLNPEIEKNYRVAGVMHVLAISGLHVGVIFWLLKILLRYPIPNKKAQYYTIVSVLVLFAFLSGLSGSIVRAVVMFSIFGYAQIINRHANTLHLMFVSMFMMLVVYPQFVFDIGFQLSYLAVFAIIWFQPFLKLYFWHENIVVRFVKEMIGVSLVAQLGVLPLTLYYFGQMPLLFLLGNIIAVPITSLVLIILIGMIPLNLFLPKTAVFLGYSVEILIEWCNVAMSWIAGFESLIIENIKITFLECILALFVVYFLGNWFQTKRRRNVIYSLGCVCLLQCCILIEKINLSKQDKLIVFSDYNHLNVLRHKGLNGVLFSSDSTFFVKNHMKDYMRYTRMGSIRNKYIQNIIALDRTVGIVDSLGYYPDIPLDFVILTGNSKVNLERLIKDVKPKEIIAYTTNKKWLILHWKATCIENNIPFHDMSEKGYYSFVY